MLDQLTDFTAFKEASDELWQRRNTIFAKPKLGDEVKAKFKDDLASFIRVGETSGSFLQREDERQSAQDLLEMWSVELVTLGDLEDNDFAVPRLAPFAGEAKPEEGGNPERTALSRDLIRLSATARQWLASGRAKGYLLTGLALEQARALIDEDRDIAELVRASDEEEHRKSRQRQKTFTFIIAALGILSTLLVIATFVAFMQMRHANQERDLVREAGDRAAIEASARNLALERSRNEAVDSANTRLTELTALQSRFDAVVKALNDADQNGSLDRQAAPQALKDLLNPDTPQFVFPAAGSTLLNGYSPDFLGIRVGLPELSADLALTAYKGGEAIPYTNYSLILDQARRLPIVSISNVDRGRLTVFPRLGLPFALDPRLPPDVQPKPDWFDPPDLDRGHLVTRREIAWSAAGDTQAASSGALYEGVVSVYSNTAPQVANLNRGAWVQLENYAIDAFNLGANRVTIFTGLAFHGAPPLELETAPTHFWKVLVSTRSDRNEPELIVEAYLLPQIDPQGYPRDLTQLLERYRVRVTDIEALTGLDFGGAIRKANAQGSFVQQQIISDDERVQVIAQGLAREGVDYAEAEKEELIRFLSQPDAPTSTKRTIVSTLAALASDPDAHGALPLTSSARSAIVEALAAVPPANWNLPEWQDIRARVRGVVSDWSDPRAGDALPLDQTARDAITRLKSVLGFQLALGNTVYFQFAGFTRPAAEAISSGLKKLGWMIPGEERSEQSAGKNEVRYPEGDDDARIKAELLAADIRALGQTQVTAVPNGRIRPGILEIWISI